MDTPPAPAPAPRPARRSGPVPSAPARPSSGVRRPVGAVAPVGTVAPWPIAAAWAIAGGQVAAAIACVVMYFGLDGLHPWIRSIYLASAGHRDVDVAVLTAIQQQGIEEVGSALRWCGVVWVVLGLIASPLGLVWFYQTQLRLSGRSATPMMSPGFALGGCFIPVYGLFHVCRIVDEQWRASLEVIGAPPSETGPAAFWPPLAWHASVVASVGVMVGHTLHAKDDIAAHFAWGMIACGVGAFSGIVLATMIVVIAHRLAVRPDQPSFWTVPHFVGPATAASVVLPGFLIAGRLP